MLQSIGGPSSALVRVTRRAGIRNFIFVGHQWCDERKSVCSYLDIRDCCLDLWHVAGDTTSPRRAFLVVRVLFDGRGPRAIQGKWAVAIQAQVVGWFSQLRIVFRAMHVVATKTGHPTAVHHALNEIISLHPVLVRRAIGEVCKRSLAQRVLFQLPEIPQI